MDNANDASQAASASSVAPMEQFDQEADKVEIFVTTHMVDYEISPAAQLGLERAKEQAYLRSNPKEGLRFLHRARVAALRYHAGQTILQASSLKERLGQKASKQASFLLGRAKIAFGESNLTLAIKESTQALTLFTGQVKQVEAIKTAAPVPLEDPKVIQVIVSTAMSAEQKREADRIRKEGEDHVARLSGKRQPQAAKSKDGKNKKSSKGKKRHLSVVA